LAEESDEDDDEVDGDDVVLPTMVTSNETANVDDGTVAQGALHLP